MGANPRVRDWTEAELDVPGAVRHVVRAPAAVLSTAGVLVDPTAADIVQLAADLVATMRVSPGCFGLAAQARALQHEIDHCDGLLSLDRAAGAHAVYARRTYL